MKILLTVIMVCLVVRGNAGAAEHGVLRLTVQEAIQSALSGNHQIKAAEYAAQAAHQNSEIADLSYYPGLKFEEHFTVSNAPTQTFMMKLDQGRFTENDFQISNLNNPTTQHDFKTSLTLIQPIYNPASSSFTKIARIESTQGRQQFNEVREATAFQVFQCYLTIQKATAQRNADKQALDEARENLRLAIVRNQVGTGLKSDELRARTELSSRELHLLNAENNLLIAQKRLAKQSNIKDGDIVEAAGAVAPLAAPASFESLLQQAQTERIDVRRLRAELDKSDAQLALSRSAFYPSLGAFASYQMNGKDAPLARDNDAWMAGVNLSWQLFDGFKRYHERDRAVAGRGAASENLEQMVSEVGLQIEESLVRYSEAAKRLEVARSSLNDAEETVRLLKKRFENALATMLELLDAQSVLNQTRSRLAEADADYILAGGQIYYSTGIFLKEIMK